MNNSPWAKVQSNVFLLADLDSTVGVCWRCLRCLPAASTSTVSPAAASVAAFSPPPPLDSATTPEASAVPGAAASFAAAAPASGDVTIINSGNGNGDGSDGCNSSSSSGNSGCAGGGISGWPAIEAAWLHELRRGAAPVIVMPAAAAAAGAPVGLLPVDGPCPDGVELWVFDLLAAPAAPGPAAAAAATPPPPPPPTMHVHDSGVWRLGVSAPGLTRLLGRALTNLAAWRLGAHGFVRLGRWMVLRRLLPPTAADSAVAAVNDEQQPEQEQPLLGVAIEWARCGARLAGHVHVRSLPLRAVSPRSCRVGDTVLVAPGGRRARVAGPPVSLEPTGCGEQQQQHAGKLADPPSSSADVGGGPAAGQLVQQDHCAWDSWRRLFNMPPPRTAVPLELLDQLPREAVSATTPRLWPLQAVFRVEAVPPPADVAWERLAMAELALSGLDAVRHWRQGNPLQAPLPSVVPSAALQAAAAAAPTAAAGPAAQASSIAPAALGEVVGSPAGPLPAPSPPVRGVPRTPQPPLVDPWLSSASNPAPSAASATPSADDIGQKRSAVRPAADETRMKRPRVDTPSALPPVPSMPAPTGVIIDGNSRVDAQLRTPDELRAGSMMALDDFSLREWLEYDDEETKRGSLASVNSAPSTTDALVDYAVSAGAAGGLQVESPDRLDKTADPTQPDLPSSWYPIPVTYRPLSVPAETQCQFSYRYTPAPMPETSTDLPAAIAYTLTPKAAVPGSSEQASEPGEVSDVGDGAGVGSDSDDTDDDVESVHRGDLLAPGLRVLPKDVAPVVPPPQPASLSLFFWPSFDADPNDRDEVFWAACVPDQPPASIGAEQSAVLEVLQQWASGGSSSEFRPSAEASETNVLLPDRPPYIAVESQWGLWSTGEFGHQPLLPPPAEAAWSLAHRVPELLALRLRHDLSVSEPFALPQWSEFSGVSAPEATSLDFKTDSSPLSAGHTPLLFSDQPAAIADLLASTNVPESVAAAVPLVDLLTIPPALGEEGALPDDSVVSCVAAQPVPRVTVGYEDSWASVDPVAAVRSWEKARLTPFSAKKDVTYYTIGPASPGLAPDIALFFSSLSSTYETGCFGQHQPGSLGPHMVVGASAVASSTAGFVPVDLEDSTSAEAAEPDGAVGNFLLAAHRLGKALGAQSGSFVGCGVLVVYLLDPFPATLPGPVGGCSAAILQCASAVMSAVRGGPAVAIVPVPLSFVVQRRDLARALRAIAFSVYNQTRRIGTTRGTLFEPLMVLSAAAEQLEPDDSTVVASVPKQRLLHVAYRASVDRRWLCCAFCDSRGELLETRVIPWGRVAESETQASDDWSPIHAIWSAASQIIDASVRTSWHVVFEKLGPFSAVEHDAWRSLLQSLVNRPSDGRNAPVSSVTVMSTEIQHGLQLLSLPRVATTSSVDGPVMLLRPAAAVDTTGLEPLASTWLLDYAFSSSRSEEIRAGLRNVNTLPSPFTLLCSLWLWQPLPSPRSTPSAGEVGEWLHTVVANLHALSWLTATPLSPGRGSPLSLNAAVCSRLARTVPFLQA